MIYTSVRWRLLLTTLAAALSVPLSASVAQAKCGPVPETCVCMLGGVYRVEATDPGALKVLEVLRDSGTCSYAVGDTVTLSGPTNGAGDAGMADSGPLWEAPDFSAGEELIVGLQCDQLNGHLVVDVNQASCEGGRSFALNEAIRLNEMPNGECQSEMAQTYPTTCDDTFEGPGGCAVAGSAHESTPLVAGLLLFGLGLLGTRRRR